METNQWPNHTKWSNHPKKCLTLFLQGTRPKRALVSIKKSVWPFLFDPYTLSAFQ